MHRHATSVISPLLLLGLGLALAWLAYAPGLHGGFLFDDFANLPALGATGPIDNWPAFWRYLTSGTADPTGRPLTLLSFLLDARNWPAAPYPFKRSSLILHLVNGALLYALLAKLGQQRDAEMARARLAAVLGASLWLLHPLPVSTTLYIVQREAMLPATFVLAGLLTWLHGRTLLAQGHMRAGTLWSLLGIAVGTALATLSKANGALLPLLALIIELIWLAPHQTLTSTGAQTRQRWLVRLLLVLPSLALLAYLAKIAVAGLLHGGPAGSRPWSIGERLLTEPRVLLDYLRLLWLPRPTSSGLFNDQYLASSSLLHPASTLPALLTVIALLLAVWYGRRRFPVCALAVLFYFGGQLMESSSIALELYFEHRNYLPAMLMFWPIGWWLADLRQLRAIKLGLMLVLSLGLAWMTHARAEVWGNAQTQALLWAAINPDSPRAQANAAQAEMRDGQPQAAIARLEKLLAQQPDQSQLVLNLLGARCQAGGVSAGDLAQAQRAMQGTAVTGSLFTSWFGRMLGVVVHGGCPGLTQEDLRKLIDTGLHNPELAGAGPQQDLTYLLGRIALAEHLPDAALADFIRALDTNIRPGFALEAAANLGAQGYPSQGLRLLNHYDQVASRAVKPGLGMPMLHAWVLRRQNYWPHEFAHLRQQLRLDAAAKATKTAPDHASRNPSR